MGATSLDAFAITRKWPARWPDRLQLYALGTPNGIKVTVMLEECDLPYEAHRVSLDSQDQRSAEFRSLNPNGKIPAILDPAGPGGAPLPLFESGAILIYLADKTGRFLAPSGAARYEALQWLMWQMAGIGPIFGQVGFFHKYAGREYEDKRPRDRYVAESRRLLGVLEAQLSGRRWVMGEDYSIVDMAIFPWVHNLVNHYKAGELVGYRDFAAVQRACEAFHARPAVQRARNVYG